MTDDYPYLNGELPYVPEKILEDAGEKSNVAEHETPNGMTPALSHGREIYLCVETENGYVWSKLYRFIEEGEK